MGFALSCEGVARAEWGEPKARQSGELLYTCPHPESHKNGDSHPSLKINTKKDVWACFPCAAKGKGWALAAFIAGCEPSDKKQVAAWLAGKGLLPERERKGKAKSGRGAPVAEFVHCDADGKPVYKKVRHEPGADGRDKDYLEWHFDDGLWKAGRGRIIPPLYRLPEIISEPMVFVFESHTDVDRAVKMGLPGTTSGGADSWKPPYADTLAGKDVCVVPDNNPPGARYAARVCASLFGKVRSLKVVSIAPHPDFRRWTDGGGTVDALFDLWEAAPDWEPLSLQAAKAEIGKWLALEPGEDRAIGISCATVLANQMPGDPLFVILIAPSSSAKTEILRGLQGDPSTHFLGSLTARTLASGYDPEKTSLLLQLDKGVHSLVIKDFGSVLAMGIDERGDLLQQLRDVYDGLLIRNWGTGKSVRWEGRLGLLAGATGAIEREFSTLNALGERFLFFRLPKGDRRKQADRALAVAGREQEMRESISKAMLGTVQSGLQRLNARPPECPQETLSALSVLAQVVTQSRTPVMRDRFDKTVDVAPCLEGPARTAKALKKLGVALAAVYGHESVGVEEIGLLAEIAKSNVPSLRRLVIEELAKSDVPLTHKAIGISVQLPTPSVSRICEDLALLGIATRSVVGDSDAGQFKVSLDPEFSAIWRQVLEFSKGCIPPSDSAVRVWEREELNPRNRNGIGEPQIEGTPAPFDEQAKVGPDNPPLFASPTKDVESPGKSDSLDV